MFPRILNPQGQLAKDMEGEWQKMASLILWKLSKSEPVTLSPSDIEDFMKAFAPHDPVLIVKSTAAGITFQIIDNVTAMAITTIFKAKGVDIG